ncbi:MAG: Gfo/Idh/MocA family oxidoreductase [Patescibacteria group bacterium]
MINKKLNIALIGAGGIGKVWAAAFKKTPEVKLACVADVDLARAKELAKGFGAKICGDWKDVLQDKNINAVVIGTPHNLLAPISYAALSSGKHVLVEKPAGINSREIQKNIVLAKKNKLVYMIGFNHRYHAAFQMARKVFEAGEIGKPTFVRARYGFGGRPGYEKEWRFNKKISGGGELIDQGVHMIDMARWFLGDFKDVKGFAESYLWKSGVEDNGFALLRTKDKKVASIHVSWTNWKWVHSFELYGEDGYLIIDGLDQRYVGPEKLTIGKRDPEFKAPPEERVFVFDKEQKEDSFARELKELASAVSEKREPLTSGQDALETLKIVETIYKQNSKS